MIDTTDISLLQQPNKPKKARTLPPLVPEQQAQSPEKPEPLVGEQVQATDPVKASVFGGIASYGVDKDEPPCPFEHRKSYDEF